MKFEAAPLPGVVVMTPAVVEDERGWFAEAYAETRVREGFAALGLAPPPAFVQHNQSRSAPWVLRGLHWQRAPAAQGKLVRVLRGAAFDVAVDLRPGSPTERRWFGLELSERNRRQVWIPPGVAHGFLALGEPAEVLYLTTAAYAPEHERALAWDDPAFAIDWPLPPGMRPRLSARDAAAPRFAGPALG